MFKFFSEGVHLSFNTSQRCVRHLQDFVIVFLRPARNKYILSVDALQRLNTGGQPAEVGADLIGQVTHEE